MTTGPARAVLTLMMNKNKKRYSEYINKDLIHVTWEPTWEPEELKDTLPNLLNVSMILRHGLTSLTSFCPQQTKS